MSDPLLENSIVIGGQPTNTVFIEQDPEALLSSKEQHVIVELNKVTTLVSQGAPGPQGPPGASAEEEMPYARQTDFINDNLLYRGEAAVGSLTSASSWRIRKLIIGNDGDVSETWADGDANFDNVWDNREALTYS